jgi:hypothetical protein
MRRVAQTWGDQDPAGDQSSVYVRRLAGDAVKDGKNQLRGSAIMCTSYTLV